MVEPVVVIASETTAKGTGLEKSAGKEDPVECHINSFTGSTVCMYTLVELIRWEVQSALITAIVAWNAGAGNTTWNEGGQRL